MIRSILRWFRCRKKPAPVTLEVGVVAHRLEDADVAALRSMNVRALRLSLYANRDGAQWIDRAVFAGFDVLVVTYRTPIAHQTDRLRWPTVRWQIQNEPDLATVSPVAAAAMTCDGDVACGLRNDTPPVWIDAFAAKLPPAMPLALHAYGQPLTLAVERRLQAAAGIPRRLWITETGQVGGTGAELTAVFEQLEGRAERCYVYALWSPDDRYTMNDSQRAAIRDWQARRHA